jgi:hypothetical protein
VLIWRQCETQHCGIRSPSLETKKTIASYGLLGLDRIDLAAAHRVRHCPNGDKRFPAAAGSVMGCNKESLEDRIMRLSSAGQLTGLEYSS